MSVELTKKVDELFSLYHTEFKDAAKQAKDEVKKYGEERAETKSALEKLQSKLDTLENESNEIIKAVKSGKNGADEKKTQADRHTELFMKKMFSKTLTNPELKEYQELESKAMQTDIAEDGGVLVPENFERSIIENVREMSPIMQLARVANISTGDTLQFTKKTANSVIGGWAANERYTVSQSTAPKYGLLNVPTHEIWAEPHITQKMLEDSYINVEGDIRADVVETFEIEMNEAFVSGNGVGQPTGFLNAFPSAQTLNSGSATAFDGDDLITLSALLKPKYERNSTWGFNRLTRAYIRKFTAADDNYLWQPGLQQNVPAILLGRPYAEITDMTAPVAATNNFADGNYPVILADWRNFYVVVVRRGMRIVRDELTSKPFIKYWFSYRVGGTRLQDEAAVILKTATA